MGGNEERTLGIDPGTVHTGWGIIELQGGSLLHVAHGTIGAAANQGQGARLSRIYHGLQEVLLRYRPKTISLEKVVIHMFYGGMPREKAEKSLRLFAEKVLPEVQAMPTPINPRSLGEPVL